MTHKPFGRHDLNDDEELRRPKPETLDEELPAVKAKVLRDENYVVIGDDEGFVPIGEAIRHILRFIGDDPDRQGLKETPNRVVASWQELFSGYKANVAELFKTFDAGSCDEMVICKDLEFYSTCEHHMLPFYGVAHIGYLPGSKVIGLSKLARILEVFARRLQIQERIGTDVTKAINEGLEGVRGAACVIEAKHMCMTCRGVNKQNSVMITSSLTGAFKESPATRSEFLSLIGKG